MLRYIYLREQQLSSWCFSDQRMIENVWCWFRLRIYTPLHSPLPAPASSYSEACRFLAPAPPRTSPGPTPSKWVPQNAKVQSCWSLTIHHSPPQSLLPRPSSAPPPPRLRQSKVRPFLTTFLNALVKISKLTTVGWTKPKICCDGSVSLILWFTIYWVLVNHTICFIQRKPKK